MATHNFDGRITPSTNRCDCGKYVLYWPFGRTSTPVFHQSNMMSFGMSGIRRVASSGVPAVVFTDFYWRPRNVRYGRTRFLIGATVVVVVSAFSPAQGVRAVDALSDSMNGANPRERLLRDAGKEPAA